VSADFEWQFSVYRFFESAIARMIRRETDE
jgi:hypothetical protein